jgi:hypothetical protein
VNPQAPVTNKFEIQHGSVVSVCNAPDEILARIKQIPDIIVETHLDGLFDVVVLFLTNREHIEGYFPRAARALRQKGFVWTLFPSASKTNDEIDYDRGWTLATRLEFRQAQRMTLNADWEAIRWIPNEKKYGRG